MGVEVVPVGAEHAGEAVGRVGDLDLHPGQAAGEEGAEVAGPGEPPNRRRLAAEQRRAPGGELRLEPVLDVAVNEVVVVVAGEEDEPLAGQVLGDQAQQPVGRIDRVADRAEEEVEEVAEEDQLVDALAAAAPAVRGRTPREAGPARSRRRSGCRR